MRTTPHRTRPHRLRASTSREAGGIQTLCATTRTRTRTRSRSRSRSRSVSGSRSRSRSHRSGSRSHRSGSRSHPSGSRSHPSGSRSGRRRAELSSSISRDGRKALNRNSSSRGSGFVFSTHEATDLRALDSIGAVHQQLYPDLSPMLSTTVTAVQASTPSPIGLRRPAARSRQIPPDPARSRQIPPSAGPARGVPT